MVVMPRRTWLRLVFSLRGSVASAILPRVFLTTLVAVILTVLYVHYKAFSVTFTVVPFSLIGLALSIFLGFRNNTSYDRFWEGRKLWGRFVNTSRSSARQVLTLVAPSVEGDAAEAKEVALFQREMVYRIAAYIHAARMHLRGEMDHARQLQVFLVDDELELLEKSHNPPISLLLRLGERTAYAAKRGWIDVFHVPILEESWTHLTDIQGGCERIKNTPIPYSYTILIHRIVAIYCFALPLGLLEEVGMLTPLVVLMVSYAFFGLDAIGDEIEEPFGTDLNDLPLSALSRMIEVNVRQSLGEEDLPPLITAQNDVLS